MIDRIQVKIKLSENTKELKIGNINEQTIHSDCIHYIHPSLIQIYVATWTGYMDCLWIYMDHCAG